MNMKFLRKLPIPQEIKKEYPLTEAMARVKAERDEEGNKLSVAATRSKYTHKPATST